MPTAAQLPILLMASLGILLYEFVREGDRRRDCRFGSPEGHARGSLRHLICPLVSFVATVSFDPTKFHIFLCVLCVVCLPNQPGRPYSSRLVVRTAVSKYGDLLRFPFAMILARIFHGSL
ncbi:hypothetical protein Zmor_019702 [Zophobas morio]|uniref:Uncharacterized protein n=1 Tax=Zophobas morio TaxID=2755281 RepID=A0AA38I596_9CUCU|nr:hypothetical protein Zmor_019702 [Zophobas morio]